MNENYDLPNGDPVRPPANPPTGDAGAPVTPEGAASPAPIPPAPPEPPVPPETTCTSCTAGTSGTTGSNDAGRLPAGRSPDAGCALWPPVPATGLAGACGSPAQAGPTARCRVSFRAAALLWGGRPHSPCPASLRRLPPPVLPHIVYQQPEDPPPPPLNGRPLPAWCSASLAWYPDLPVLRRNQLAALHRRARFRALSRAPRATKRAWRWPVSFSTASPCCLPFLWSYSLYWVGQLPVLLRKY